MCARALKKAARKSSRANLATHAAHAALAALRSARAVVTTAPPEKLVAASHLAALTSARAQLIASHFGDRRRHVWGAVADGSLADLKKEVVALWQECAVSGEVAEAVRCVRELEAPSYHHEVVKRAVSASIVDGGPREFELALRLTSELCEADVLTTDQLSLGCTRLVEASPDLQLDYPRAPELLAQCAPTPA